jgi:hypothetical protein
MLGERPTRARVHQGTSGAAHFQNAIRPPWERLWTRGTQGPTQTKYAAAGGFFTGQKCRRRDTPLSFSRSSPQ